MFNVGGGELLVVLLIALLVLGPDRLPGFARKAGKVMRDLRRISQGFQNELRQAIDFDGDDTARGPASTAPSTVHAPRLVEPPPPHPGPAGDVQPSPATEPGGESTSGSSAA